MPNISGKFKILFFVFISKSNAAIMSDEFDLLEIADRKWWGRGRRKQENVFQFLYKIF